MQIRGDIVTHEGEEGGDTEGFVAVTEDLEVDGIVVEENAEPCDEGVDGDHEKNANDTGNPSMLAMCRRGAWISPELTVVVQLACCNALRAVRSARMTRRMR